VQDAAAMTIRIESWERKWKHKRTWLRM